MFGGILEVTKESDDIYIFHIPTCAWKLVHMNEGPLNLNNYFQKEEALEDNSRNLASQMEKMNYSSPDVMETQGNKMNLTVDMAGNNLNTESKMEL